MPSSVRDIQILRGNRAGKAALVSSDFRLAAVLVSKEFDLLFFPDRIQRLWRIVTGLIGDFLHHFFTVDRGVGELHQQIEQHRVAALTLLKTRAEQRQDRRDVLQTAQRLFFWQLRQIFQIERQVIRQLAAVELQAVLLVLCHQVNHRLTAVAGFTVNVFEQQQRGSTPPIKQLTVVRLRIKKIARQQVTEENAQLLGIFFIQVFRCRKRIKKLLLVLRQRSIWVLEQTRHNDEFNHECGSVLLVTSMASMRRLLNKLNLLSDPWQPSPKVKPQPFFSGKASRASSRWLLGTTKRSS